MAADPQDLQRRVLAAFQVEYREQLEVIRALLARWPATPGAALDEAFRMAHSMKGGARVCDLGEVERLAHQMESLLQDLSKGQAVADDAARQRLEKLCDQVEDVMSQADVADQPSPEAATPAPAAQDTLRIEVRHLDRLLQNSGLLLTEAVRQENVDRQLDEFAQEFELLRQVSTAEDADAGEVRSRMLDLGKRLQRVRGLQKETGRSVRVLAEQVQANVRRASMVPISSVFEAFPKMVRDLAASEKKEVRLTMEGTEQQAHRAVLQLLKDPVMHLLRNAVAHGIETPAGRRNAGKPQEGHIHLQVRSEGGHLHIRIQDDGRGIDPEQIRQQAVRNRLLGEEAAGQITLEQTLDLLFLPRFSTASEITEVSGRGVGLSVVKERLIQLQGSVRLSSTPGAGCRVDLVAPVSISAHRILLVRAAGSTYALPLRAIRTVLRVKTLSQLDGKTMVDYRGTPVLMATAAEAAGAPAGVVRGPDGYLLVAILEGERLLALHIEDVLEQTSAIIKPLPFPASRSPHFSGGVVLEDGGIALVLNLDNLARSFQGGILPEEKAPQPVSRRKPAILVVDDSFTARTLQKSIFETAGYRVWVATDGLAALDLLRSQAIDAVVSDIQMPRMNGFELLEKLKANSMTAQIPVILVTSLSSREDQERGLSLGADAYIVKERFDHRELLSTIRQLV